MATAPAQWDESTAVPVSGQSQQWDESTAVPLRPAAPAAQAAPSQQPAAAPAPQTVSAQPPAPRQPDTVSAAPPQTWSQRAREGIANSVVGRNLEAVAPGVAESLHLQPTLIPGTPEYEDQTYSAPALNKVLPDWAQKPLIPAEDTSTMVGRAQAATAARFRQAHPIAGAVTQGLSETVAGLTSPVNLALLAAAPEAKPLMALFATQAAQGSYQNAEQAYQAYRQGNNPQAAKFATESGLNAVIAGLAGRAAVKGAFPVDTGRPAVTAPLVEMPREPLALPAPEGSVPAEAARPAPPPGVGPIIEGEGVPIPAQTPRAAPAPPPAPAAHPPQAPNLAQAEAALRGKSIEEIQRAGQPAAAPVVPPPPSTIQPAPDSPQGASATPQTPVPAPAAPAAPQPQSGGQRPAVQASGEPAELRKSAQEQKPDLEAMAGQVAAAVPGTDVVGPRVKKIDSMENKAGRVDENGVAKTPETIEDPLGVRLVAPKPAAVSAVEQAVREKMPVVSTDKIDSNGLDVTQFGVAGRPGEPMQTMEVQVVKGPAQAAAMKASDADYDRQKEVQAEADKAAPGSWQQKAAQKEADEIGAQIEARMVKAKAQDAKQPENQGRAKLSESSEQTQLGNPAPAKLLTKGTPVTLKDGTQGTIKGGNPNEPNGGRWMVNTPKGSVLANGNDLRQVEAAHVDNEPIGNPIPARVAQVKQLLDQGTDVRIFTARVADDPSGEVRAQIEKWAEQNLGRKVPITNAKDDNLAFLLDDKANVPANANTPFQIPPIPKGKWLGVDLDRTLVKQPTEGGTANEQRISAEQPAGAVANIPKEEKANASEVGKPAEMAVHPEREEGAGGSGRAGMAGQQQGTQPAGESAVQAKPGGEENRPKERYEQIVGAWLRRAAMDQQGQGVLDDMIENGESPRAISDKFWEDTYWKLPSPVQERFQKQLSAHWGGMKPGDTIGSRPDKSAIVARDWWDLAKESDLPTEAEYLEGTDRGYVVLMREANERFGGGPEKVQKGTPEKKPDQLTGGDADRKEEVEPVEKPVEAVKKKPVDWNNSESVVKAAVDTSTWGKQEPNQWDYQRRINPVVKAFEKANRPESKPDKPPFSTAARAKVQPKKVEEVPASQTAIEQHRAAHVPGAFARLVTEHGHAADALVKLMRDPKADPKELAAAAAKVDELAPEVEKESPGGGPIYAEDYGYKKPTVAKVESKAEAKPEKPAPVKTEGGEVTIGSAQPERGGQREDIERTLRTYQEKGKPAIIEGDQLIIRDGRYQMTWDNGRLKIGKIHDLAKAGWESVLDRSGIGTQDRWTSFNQAAKDEYDSRAKDRADRDAEAQAKRETEEMERAHTAELQERFTTEMRDRLARAKFTPGTMIPRGPKGELPEVKGDTLGGLIVHKAISKRTFSNKRGSGSDWEVSHIPSGLAILRGLSNRDNAKIAAVRLADIGNWNRPQKELEADKDLRGRGAELAKAVREGATAMTPNDLKAMEARPVPEKAPVPSAMAQDVVREMRRKYAGTEGGLGQGRHGDLLDARKGSDSSRSIGEKETTGEKPELLTQLSKREPGTAAGASDRAGVGKPSDLGTKFYSNPFFDPGLYKQFIGDPIKEWASDKETTGDTQKALMRETRGQRDRREAIAAHKLSKELRDWDRRSRADSLAFMNAVEHVGGKTIDDLAPKDRDLAELLSAMGDHLKAKIEALQPDVIRHWIENYYAHLWEKPSQARSVIQAMYASKRPFAGRASFLRQRTVPNMQDGIDMGLKPATWNPVRNALLKFHEMNQFIMGHETLQVMKDSGTAKYVRAGSRQPEGWVRLDDRIGTVYGREKIINENKLDAATYDKTYKGGNQPIPSVARADVDEAMNDATIIRGYYYAPADAAKAFNNYMSTGLAGRSGVYDALRWANNNLNIMQLSISGFHATMTTFAAAAGDTGLAIQQATEGKPIEAGVSLFRGVTALPSLINTLRNGIKLHREYVDPGTYAEMSRQADAIARAGGRFAANTVEIRPLDKAVNALRNGAVLEGLSAVPGTLLHAITDPLMKFYVPMMKFGAFYNMSSNVLENAEQGNWSPEQTRVRVQEAWKSVDNRFGELVRDNLFWHKALLDVLDLTTRSVGYTYGTINEYAGAAYDTAKQAGKAASGQRPRVTDRMAFAIASFINAGIIGGALTYLMTGQRPREWKDYYFPKKANGSRLSMPVYPTQIINMMFHPVSTMTNKISPILGALTQAIQNRDFYGTEIRHPDDSTVKQLWEFSKWAARQPVPFAAESAERQLKQRGAGPSLAEILHSAHQHPGDVVSGFFGFNPAPAYIEHSTAYNLAQKYSLANRPPGTKTAEDTARYDAKQAIRTMQRTGDVDQDQIDRYVQQGVLKDEDVDKVMREADEVPIVHAAKSLHVDQYLNVYQKATPEEREALEEHCDKIVERERREQIEDGIDAIKKDEADKAVPSTSTGGGG